MTYYYSRSSQANLDSCHPYLQEIFTEVLKYFDHTIIEGYRTPERQKQLFDQGLSKIESGGMHNSVPSLAVDACPYPVDFYGWDNNPTKRHLLYVFAGMIIIVAEQKGYKIRWGGDWDSDWDFTDQNFNDLVHFELVLPKGE